IYLSRCLGETCSPPSKIFQRSGRLGRIVLSSQPDTGQLFMLLSYWDHENQSQVVEGLAEAQGYRGVRLSPDAQYVSATRVPFLYNGADSAFAVWDQTPGRKASTEMGGMVALAEYDYGESHWKASVATYLAGGVEMFAADPLIAKHGDSLWTSFVAYRGAEVNEQGLRQMPRAAPTGDLYLVRVEPDKWEARGAEQAGKEYEPARN
ncbi:MAG TPA: hypothetical protein VLV83_20015, partial [Acidobacteriota bacterium]|nr:hypothetical protein [Acidobacteriota bacterium]